MAFLVQLQIHIGLAFTSRVISYLELGSEKKFLPLILYRVFQGIWTSITWPWWFGFRLETIGGIVAHNKSGLKLHTIKLGYNVHSYNKITVITNKCLTNFCGPKWQGYFLNLHGYNDVTVITNIFPWSREWMNKLATFTMVQSESLMQFLRRFAKLSFVLLTISKCWEALMKIFNCVLFNARVMIWRHIKQMCSVLLIIATVDWKFLLRKKFNCVSNQLELKISERFIAISALLIIAIFFRQCSYNRDSKVWLDIGHFCKRMNF